MATRAEWIEGARLRTLPAAIAPVLAGTGVAAHFHQASVGRALLALIVALALQVGVNYANDYSDGVRGTDSDANRVGPQRLVGSGAAEPEKVKRAAFICFGIACLAGIALTALCGAWWLLIVGAACVAAAWFYTGGKHPYGYMGLGEVFVFVFFGLVATIFTTFSQMLRVASAAVWAGIATGALACAILVANNLRDIDGDTIAGKRTLAVRLGDRGTRYLYAGLVVLSAIGFAGAAGGMSAWAALAFLGLAVVYRPLDVILKGATGSRLVDVLKYTGIAELAACVLLLVGGLLG